MRAVLRALGYLAVTLPLMPVQALALAFDRPLARQLPPFYHRICARILGVDVISIGEPCPARPVLFVGNHSSYLDILVLSSVLDASFIAKAEIARWPLFGTLARLQRTVFIERRPSRTLAQRDEIGRRLAAGDRLILFPEGTSDDGIHLLPFRSALFSVAERAPEGRPLTVQPFSLAYTRLDGLPIGREWRPLVAWYGGIAMFGHLWRLVSLGHITVELRFFDPVTIDAFDGRKRLSDYCEGVVSAGLALSIAGRGSAAPAGPDEPEPAEPDEHGSASQIAASA